MERTPAPVRCVLRRLHGGHHGVLLWLLFAAALACERPAPPPRGADAVSVVDDSGRTVELPAPAQRIVSLIPALTDVILRTGAADRLVARTVYDTDPRIASLPSFGDALTPSVEWLVSRNPDLVLAWPDRQSRTVVTRLVELGVPVYTSTIETLDDMHRGIANLGVLLDIESTTDSLIAEIDSTLNAIRSAVSGRDTVSVLYLIGLDPPMSAGPGSFVDDLISLSGGHNIMSDATTAWPPVSVEEIVAREPDVVIVAATMARLEVLDALRARPGLRQLAAVRENRVHVLDPSLFNRPGPGLIEAAGVLARTIHPEAF